MDEFAPQSLLPSLISGMAIADLRAFIQENFWDEDPDALVNLLSASPRPDTTVQANADLYELAQGRWTVEQWLELYGHRAADEFDLSTPRWRERTEELVKLAARLKDGASPLELHQRRAEQAQREAGRAVRGSALVMRRSCGSAWSWRSATSSSARTASIT